MILRCLRRIMHLLRPEYAHILKSILRQSQKNTRGLTPPIFVIRRFHQAPPPDPHLNNNSNNNNKNLDNDMNNDNNNLICTPNTNMYTNIYS